MVRAFVMLLRRAAQVGRRLPRRLSAEERQLAHAVDHADLAQRMAAWAADNHGHGRSWWAGEARR